MKTSPVESTHVYDKDVSSIAEYAFEVSRKDAALFIPLSQEDLIKGLQNKTSNCYEVLYDMYASSLFGVIIKIVKDIKVAEDTLSETFVKIVNSFDQYDSSKGKLFTWMINIARHESIDKLRSEEHRNSLRNSCIASEVKL
ncbi:MAG TPA: sigma factor [Pedobacter sp.]|jgi:RNA polymerase sigma-70 factor (ECF subfamily)